MPNGIASRLAAAAPPAGRCRRHHAADGDHPRHRQVDLPEQDDEHRAGGDDAEEGGDLQLLQQVLGRQEVARIEAADRAARARCSRTPHATGGSTRRRTPARHRAATCSAAHRRGRASPEQLQPVAHREQLQRAEAHRRQQDRRPGTAAATAARGRTRTAGRRSCATRARRRSSRSRCPRRRTATCRRSPPRRSSSACRCRRSPTDASPE